MALARTLVWFNGSCGDQVLLLILVLFDCMHNINLQKFSDKFYSVFKYKYFWYTAANKCITTASAIVFFVNIVIIILIVSDMRRKMKIPSFSDDVFSKADDLRSVIDVSSSINNNVWVSG